MSFPISIFLYIYFAFLLFWVVFSLAEIYHMLKYGFKTATTFFITFGYLAVSLIIISASLIYISQVNWQSELSVFSGVLSETSEYIQE
jgi:hypothetical protein